MIRHARARAQALLEQLPRIYPDAHCELDFTNALELLVATILSAQCTDVRVNIVTKALFARCRTAADYAAIPAEELETLIKSTGFFRNKAKNIQAAARELVAKHGGEVPRSMATLHALPGVGRKTANVVLGNAFGINEGVVVDTHVGRLSIRLGLTEETDAVKVEAELMQLVPREHWTMFSHWLIFHGRRRCKAQNPDCDHCELLALCPRRGLEKQPLAGGPKPRAKTAVPTAPAKAGPAARRKAS
ncbi:MAG: endonuclease III [Verrucomicrobia bacterium]|nr:endonuclease III [Verrucomicrobiota bacterium]